MFISYYFFQSLLFFVNFGRFLTDIIIYKKMFVTFVILLKPLVQDVKNTIKTSQAV